MVFHRRLHRNRDPDFKGSHLRYASKTYSQYQVVVKLLGSFRLTAGNRHLHRYCIFTELFSETVASRYTIRARRNLPDKEFRSSIPRRRTISYSTQMESRRMASHMSRVT